MKRTDKGFMEISWDQALDEIAEKLLGLKDQYGAQVFSTFCGSIGVDISIVQAAERMKEEKVRRFPVVRGDELIGIVTDRDLRSAAPSGVFSFDSHERELMPELHSMLSKVKIKEINFVGNQVFGRSKLRSVLKKTKQKSLRYYFGDKIVYTREAWDEDRDNLRKFYGDRGYIDVKIGEPALELIAKNPDAPTLKKKKYKMHR